MEDEESKIEAEKIKLAMSDNTINSLAKFVHKDLGLYSEFGFYESYDYDDKEIVLSYFAHHQGMILASLANYLKTDVIRNYLLIDSRALILVNTINIYECREILKDYGIRLDKNDIRITNCEFRLDKAEKQL